MYSKTEGVKTPMWDGTNSVEQKDIGRGTWSNRIDLLRNELWKMSMGAGNGLLTELFNSVFRAYFMLA